MSTGRWFQARGTATANVRSPSDAMTMMTYLFELRLCYFISHYRNRRTAAAVAAATTTTTTICHLTFELVTLLMFLNVNLRLIFSTLPMLRKSCVIPAPMNNIPCSYIWRVTSFILYCIVLYYKHYYYYNHYYCVCVYSFPAVQNCVLCHVSVRRRPLSCECQSSYRQSPVTFNSLPDLN